MREYYVIKSCTHKSIDKEPESIMEHQAREVMSEGYYKYTRKHGYHFTSELAEYASSAMENRNNTNHCWSVSEVMQVVNSLGVKNVNNLTEGDMTYLSNMAYADFYPTLLKSEQDCIKYAIMLAEDVDGYEGIAFTRWVADLIGKGVTINWEIYC